MNLLSFPSLGTLWSFCEVAFPFGIAGSVRRAQGSRASGAVASQHENEPAGFRGQRWPRACHSSIPFPRFFPGQLKETYLLLTFDYSMSQNEWNGWGLAFAFSSPSRASLHWAAPEPCGLAAHKLRHDRVFRCGSQISTRRPCVSWLLLSIAFVEMPHFLGACSFA